MVDNYYEGPSYGLVPVRQSFESRNPNRIIEKTGVCLAVAGYWVDRLVSKITVQEASDDPMLSVRPEVVAMQIETSYL